MKKSYILFLFPVLLTAIIFGCSKKSESPTNPETQPSPTPVQIITFKKTFDYNNFDTVYSVLQIDNDNYIIAGYTMELNGTIYLMKADNYGNTVWIKSFGGIAGDFGFSVCKTNEGGFIIAGTTSSYGSGGNDIYIIKTDSSGNSVWEKTFGDSGNDAGWSVIQTVDGGFVIAGETESPITGNYDIYLIKTDSNGNVK